MASKKQQASSGARSGASQPQQAQTQAPRLSGSTMSGTLRYVALLSATFVAVLVFEVLQTPIGFWPALIVGLLCGVVARAAFVWLERVWLGAAARRAAAHEAARQAERGEPKAAGKSPRKR